LRRWRRRSRLRVKAAGRRQRDGRNGGADRAGGQPSDIPSHERRTPTPEAHHDDATFGNDSSPLGVRCFIPLARPLSTTNSKTTSPNCGVRNRSPFTWTSGSGGDPGETSDRPVASWYFTCTVVPVGVW